MHLSVSTWTGNRRIGARRGYDIGSGEERRSRRDRGDGYIDGEDTEEEEADMLLLDPKFFSKVGRCIAYVFNIVTHLHRMYFN